MSVRAKCRVTGLNSSTSITGAGNVEQVTVTLQPVYGNGEDKANEQWSRWTPSGEIRLCITNPEAFNQFKLGKAFFVDFTPADE